MKSAINVWKNIKMTLKKIKMRNLCENVKEILKIKISFKG